MHKPMTLPEMEKLSEIDTSIKPMLREMYVFPRGTHTESRFLLKQQGIQRINDIVMFHKFVMFVHESSKEIIDPVFEKFNSHYCNLFDNIQGNQEQIAESRTVFQNFNEKEQLRRVGLLADESLVINLWATIEQFANRSINLYKPNTKKSYRWHDIEKSFLDHGVNLKSAMSYPIIDELRRLNNNIKHTYMVDDKLAALNNFAEYKGKTIDQIVLNTFEYTLASYNFLCFLINRTGDNEYYPNDDSDDSEEQEYSKSLRV